mmetsp:Transcript_52122/g.153798  ORF Transcript_52122/g.153798 Transcript_52122/m.153798 type:complete len:436 (+) Transcript_52122:89-1396(+)
MKQRFLLVAVVVAQLATAAAVDLRRLRHQEAAGRLWRQSAPSSETENVTNASNGTNSSNATWVEVKCNFTEDLNGVIQPANCTSNTSSFCNTSNANCTCRVMPDMTFDLLVNKTNCTPPKLATCTEPDFGELYMVTVDGPPPSEEEEEEEEVIAHNHSLHGVLSCTADAAPIDLAFSNQTWGEKWYKGPKFEDTWCNNGTWLEPKKKFKCVTIQQIMMLKDMEHYLGWSEKELAKAEAINFKWIDSGAVLRKNQLMYAQYWAHRMLMDANSEDLEVPEVKDMKVVLKVLKGDSGDIIIPHGEPMSEETCKDMEKEFSGATVAGRTDAMPFFTCTYTQQRTSIGYDHTMNEIHQQRDVAWFFRDGCMCESVWSGGCPFKLHYKKGYKAFGFAGLDEKVVSRHAGVSSANALCWYWSDPTHPEWGYVNRGKNPSTVL